MNRTLPILFASLLFLASCSKDTLTTSPEARVRFSADTLRFDTVFTAAGSVTASVKIFNPNDARIRLSSIKLGGGTGSPFRINADGIPGPTIADLEIAAKDSAYVFVTVNVNPTSAASPFLITDSIMVSYNGRIDMVQLNAYGQNARYIRSQRITGNTTWDKALPYVVIGGVQVDRNVTLTLEPGTRVYLHADAPLLVDGTLRAIGTRQDSIVFRGDRLDKEYRDLPASWPGIYFRETSAGNQLRYVIIRNAYQGVVAFRPSPTPPKADLSECIIDNVYDAAIYGINSSIRAVNCLVSNSGLNILLTNGGDYEFTHCTVASYANSYIPHKKPVCVITNWDSTTQINSYPLNARIRNTIFWGENGIVDNEVVVSRRGSAAFSVLLENTLYKAAGTVENATLLNNIVNQPPKFDSIREASRYYDFRINKGVSPAINKGRNLGVALDLEGKPRDAQPDIGCYEKQ